MLRQLNQFAPEVLVDGELFVALECGHYFPTMDAEHEPEHPGCAIPTDEQWCRACDASMLLN